MNVKLKALIAVIAGVGGMTLLAIGIASIPQTWVKEYGMLVLEGLTVGVCLTFMYWAALDYFKFEEKQKKERKGGYDSREDKVF